MTQVPNAFSAPRSGSETPHLGAAVSRTCPEFELCANAISLELNSWLLDLPSPLRLETAREPLPTHVINMHAMCRYLQILLHRPTYTRPFGATSEARDLAIKTCDFAAYVSGIPLRALAHQQIRHHALAAQT
jgi:hypothetical protein